MLWPLEAALCGCLVYLLGMVLCVTGIVFLASEAFFIKHSYFIFSVGWTKCGDKNLALNGNWEDRQTPPPPAQFILY